MGWFAELQCAAADFPAAAALLAPSGVRLLIDHLAGFDPAGGLDQPGFRSVLDAGGTGRAVVKLSGAFRRSRVPYPHADLDPLVAALLDAFSPAACVWGSDWPFINWAAKPDYRHDAVVARPLGARRAGPPGHAVGDACGAVRVRGGGTVTRRTEFRVAVAGAGMVTRHHLLAWRKLPQVEVVAVCARHIENARARAAEFGVPRGLRGCGRDARPGAAGRARHRHPARGPRRAGTHGSRARGPHPLPEADDPGAGRIRAAGRGRRRPGALHGARELALPPPVPPGGRLAGRRAAPAPCASSR